MSHLVLLLSYLTAFNMASLWTPEEGCRTQETKCCDNDYNEDNSLNAHIVMITPRPRNSDIKLYMYFNKEEKKRNIY